MKLFLYLFLCIATIFLMEGFAWFTHKYIMHGFMWRWHKSHHRPPPHHGLERNDLFALIFSMPAVLLMVIGGEIEGFEALFYVGLGIFIYGILYFVFHDIIVHKRIKISFKAKNPYLIRIMRAHYIHHTTHTKDGAEAFGFLYAIKKYTYKKAKKGVGV